MGVKDMLVFSIGSAKKKWRLLAKLLVILCLLALLGYGFNYTLAAAADTPIVINSGGGSEEGERHYPGEPIRVYNNLEEYEQDKLAGEGE